MVTYYALIGSVLRETDTPGKDVSWVRVEAPTPEECRELAIEYDVDEDAIQAALDPEETPRLEREDEYTLMLVDIPVETERHGRPSFRTIPLGLVLTGKVLLTVCSKENQALNRFARARKHYSDASTFVEYICQIMLYTASYYQEKLHWIDLLRARIEKNAGDSPDFDDITELHVQEETLIYFTTSLKANETVIRKFVRIVERRSPEDLQDDLEDAVVEISQAIEMSTIYRELMAGTRSYLSSVLDYRLNTLMKLLTAVTIILAIPTLISGLYGMNVDSRWMPFAQVAFGFEIILLITGLICLAVYSIMKHKEMF